MLAALSDSACEYRCVTLSVSRSAATTSICIPASHQFSPGDAARTEDREASDGAETSRSSQEMHGSD